MGTNSGNPILVEHLMCTLNCGNFNNKTGKFCFLLTVTSDLLYNIITCQAVHVLYKQYYLGAV